MPVGAAKLPRRLWMFQVTKHLAPEEDDGEDLYHVAYDDGDSEDLDCVEVKRLQSRNFSFRESRLICLRANATLANPSFANPCLCGRLCYRQLEEAITIHNYNKLYPLVRKKVSISTSTTKKKVALFGENREHSPVFRTVKGYHDDGYVRFFSQKK